MHKIAKNLFNFQNIYDGILFGLNYMPTKPIEIATATITSSIMLYVVEPESWISSVCVITISSGFAWAAIEITHSLASQLWKKKLAEVEAEYNQYEKTPKSIENKRQVKEEVGKLLDDLFADPHCLKS